LRDERRVHEIILKHPTVNRAATGETVMDMRVPRSGMTAALDPAIDDPRLQAQVRAIVSKVGRVHLPDFLTAQTTKTMYEAMATAPWRLVFAGVQENFDLAAEQVAALDVGQKENLAEAIHAQASTGFQYLFDSYRVSDEAEAGRLVDGPFADFFALLNSDAMLDRMRALTGDKRIAYLDAQATRYRPGHFLTVHDDAQDGKDRLYAYVINLTPVWRADWGGLLMFLSDDGHVAEAFTPRWNAINILKVPQPHAVSFVSPFARGARFSITGWMRSKRP